MDSSDSARWCVSRRAASRSTGRGDPRTDTRCLAWARSQLEPGRWREGYARLIDVAGHSPRIGRRAGLEWRYPTKQRSGRTAGFPIARGSGHSGGLARSELARKFVRFLLETRQAELAPDVRARPASGFEADFDSLVADLLGATLVDAQDELWAAWEVLERAGSPEPARKWLTEPPPWPPASIEKYLKREGEHAMSLIETLAGELSPRPAVRGLADPELALLRRGSWIETLLAEMARAADGELVHEPRFRSWLRAEWTASARQRYRRVAKLAATAQARYGCPLKGHVQRHDPRHPGRPGETLRHDRRGRRRIARAAAGRDDVRSGPGRRGQDDAGSPGDRPRSARTMARSISVIGWSSRCRPTNARRAWFFRTWGSGRV